MTTPAPPLASVVPDVDETVARVVDGALAFEKAKRWPSARRMQEAVRRAYRARTGRSISMAPKPVVPEAIANSTFGSGDVASPGQAAPAVAMASVERRPRGVAMAFAAGAAAVVAIAMAFVHADYWGPARGNGSPPQAPSGVLAPPPAPTSRSTSGEGPSSSPPEPRAVAATDLPAAPTTTAAVKASSAPKATAKTTCETPFMVDPVTHIKHWRLDCL
jgi:hypothetical protein